MLVNKNDIAFTRLPLLFYSPIFFNDFIFFIFRQRLEI